jgi:ABC-type amino acid transport substrate-binding protein
MPRGRVDLQLRPGRALRLRAALLLVHALLLPQSGAGSETPVPAQLHACTSDTDWPPFSYASRDPGHSGELVGYTPEYLRAALPAPVRVAIDTMPWKRCLAMAAGGERDMVLDMLGTAERAETFALPPPYYTLRRFVVLYRRDGRPMHATRAAELAGLRSCMQKDWSQLGTLHLLPGPVHGPRTYDAAVAMLAAGRCDVLFGPLDVLRGYGMIGGADVFRDARFRSQELPGEPDSPHYFGVSRQVGYSQALVALLSAGIERMQRSGAEAQLWKAHVAKR